MSIEVLRDEDICTLCMKFLDGAIDRDALLAALLDDAGYAPFWVKLDSDGLPDGGFHTESGPGLTEILLRVSIPKEGGA